MPDQPPTISKATLGPVGSKDPVKVQFNPATLVYSVENSISQQSKNPKKVQYVAQTSGKLTMDLQFDTTDTGSDVRFLTNQVARYMQASAQSTVAALNAAPPTANGAPQGPPPKAPPVLQFTWGSYIFQGLMDSFKETIDLFSADGVALRAVVSIGLSRQDQVFDERTTFKAATVVPTGQQDSAFAAATRGGDSNAARQLGADNGLESLRFTDGAPLEVNSGVQLNPPAAFVTAPSASAAASASAGASGGVSAGISGGAQTGGLGAAFGASASAGVSASAGAFAGLQTGRAQVSSTVNLDPLQMLNATVSTDVSTFNGASFSIGGAANSTGSAGLSTDVGTSFNFSDRLTFSSDD